jgi:TonB family protein
MTALSAGVPQPMRSPWSFMGSICLHGWVLAWVALGPLPLEPNRPLYEREIQPNEKKIIWYKLSDRLPDVTPPESKRDLRPPRARGRFEQSVTAGPKDNTRPAQLIWAPAPEIAPAEPLPLPNIVALAPPAPRLVQPFIPPPVKAPAPQTAALLPEAPRVAPGSESKPFPIDVKSPRPLRRSFTPPAAPKPPVTQTAAALPEAPKLAAATESKPFPIDVKSPRPLRRNFTPPAAPKPTLTETPAVLPEGPSVAGSTPGPLASGPNIPRKFVVPPDRPATPADPVAIAASPPSLPSPMARPSENSLVVVGLNPANSVEVPAPPGSVRAGFSGGPKPQPQGGEGTPTGAPLEVPSLTLQGGAKEPQPPVMVARVSPTSPEALAAALRTAHGAARPTTSSAHPLARAASAPDPRMYGRQVYTMAIQVPNLTSYSGSWLVWFAERELDIGGTRVDLRPPLPLRMVDPKYIVSAAGERVEGKVRLWAVIGKDGHVADISLLQHLDDRLDRSAEEALGKWLFEPAQRSGVAVDVDAVFEIPFYLAPKNER